MKVTKEVVGEIETRAHQLWESWGKPAGAAGRSWDYAKWQVRHRPRAERPDLTALVQSVEYIASGWYRTRKQAHGGDLGDFVAAWLERLQLDFRSSAPQHQRKASFWLYEPGDVDTANRRVGEVCRLMAASRSAGIRVEIYDQPDWPVELRRLQDALTRQPERERVAYLVQMPASAGLNSYLAFVTKLEDAGYLWHSDSERLSQGKDWPHRINHVALANPDAVAFALQADFYCR